MAINVIEYPNGKFGYAGSVPVDLSYRITGGTAANRRNVREAVSHVGPGMAKKLAIYLGVNMESKSFDSRAEAYDVASAYVEAMGLGVKVNG